MPTRGAPASSSAAAAASEAAAAEPAGATSAAQGRLDALATLDACVRGKQLADLHVHLMGQGSDDFWVGEVMVGFLATERLRGERPTWYDISRPRGYCVPLLHPSLRTVWEPRPVVCLRSLDGAEHYLEMDEKAFAVRFSTDVVYSLERLCVGMFPDDPYSADSETDAPLDFGHLVADPDLPEEWRDKSAWSQKPASRVSLSRTLSVLHEAWRRATETPVSHRDSPPPCDRLLGAWVVFNAKKTRFEVVAGVRNAALVWMLRRLGAAESEVGMRGVVGGKQAEVSTLEAKLRNCFSMLEESGAPLSVGALPGFRGSFDPHFYPRRFHLKDSIVEQRPDVLRVLMRHVCERYADSGVYYTEISVSAKDLLEPTFWHHAVDEPYGTPLTALYKEKVAKKSRAPTATSAPSASPAPSLTPATSSSSSSLVSSVDRPASSSSTSSSHVEAGPSPVPLAWTETPRVPGARVATDAKPLASGLRDLDEDSRAEERPASAAPTHPHRGDVEDECESPGFAPVPSTSPLQPPDAAAPGTGSAARPSPAPAPPSTRSFYEPPFLGNSHGAHKPTDQGVFFLAAFPRDLDATFFEEEADRVLFNADIDARRGVLRMAGFGEDDVLDLGRHVPVPGRPFDDDVKEEKARVSDIMCLALRLASQRLASSWRRNPLSWLQYLARGERWRAILDHPTLLERVFETHSKSMTKLANAVEGIGLERLSDLERAKLECVRPYLLKYCVGVDLVGCEFGRPFSPFLLNSGLRMLGAFVARNAERHARFGVRFHAGECVPRVAVAAAVLDVGAVAVDSGLVAHLAATVHTMERLRAAPGLASLAFRIGHGVAFLHDVAVAADAPAPAPPRPVWSDPVQLRERLRGMRETLVRLQIPVEVNLTSNCVLLADNFSDHDHFGNFDQLSQFVETGFTVVLSTDNDGVCPIYSCKAHNRHASLAREFCMGITLGSISSAEIVRRLVGNAKQAVFVACGASAGPGETDGGSGDRGEPQPKRATVVALDT